MLIGVVTFLEEGARFFWGIHILGVVFGLGAATVTDVMFLHFMRNFRIQTREAEIMKTLSKIVWVGIGLLIMSGVALMIPRWDIFLASDRFMMKLTAVGVVIINGIVLNLWIQPRARRISFIKPDADEVALSNEEIQKRVKLRRIAFALGGISFISWYGAFSLAVLNMIALSYLQLMLIFAASLGVAIVASQFKEYQYRKVVEEELEEDPLV